MANKIDASAVVAESVKLGQNVVIEPFCVLLGDTVVEDGAKIESFCYIVNSNIGKNTVVKASRIVDSVVGANSTVGPNAHLRDKAEISEFCRIGNFVEIKNSKLGSGTKVAHLAYVGDAEIGNNCNIGCGVIFANYNGKTKSKTTIGNNSFIGCNSNLIAPLNIGENVYIACGSTVNKDLQTGDFAIGRTELVVKENYSKKYLC